MKFKIPFTFADMEILKRRSKWYTKFAGTKKRKLDDYLKNSDKEITGKQYLSICYRSFLINLLISAVVFTSILGTFGANKFYFYGIGTAILVSGFVFINQVNYPKIFASNKTRNIEKNLIPVLQDMMVQLSSGVPIFRIMMNISSSDYGEVSKEFSKMTKEINSGIPQIEAIEKYGKISTSEYFKRVLWQISNGMRAGSDMNIVIKEGIKRLSDEQAIQIQAYGSKLNPIVMFYMLLAVIIPSLGITFLIILSSMLNLEKIIVQLIFFLIFGVVVFIQIMFLGLIKSRRPSLL
jgi:flagellar protein FlaJ